MRISKIASRRVSPILTLWAFLFVLHSVHPMRVSRSMGDWRQKTVLGSQRPFGTLNYFCGGLEQLLMYIYPYPCHARTVTQAPVPSARPFCQQLTEAS